MTTLRFDLIVVSLEIRNEASSDLGEGMEGLHVVENETGPSVLKVLFASKTKE